MFLDIHQPCYLRHSLPHRDVRQNQVPFLRLAKGLFCMATFEWVSVFGCVLFLNSRFRSFETAVWEQLLVF